MRLRRIRLALWITAAFAAIVLAVLLLRPAPEAAPQQIAIGGPFTLVASDGKPFSSAQLAGKPHAIFFGFTHCPDVCPTTLARLVKLRRALGRGDDAFAILFVSVDPERDGPREVGRYSALFGSPVIGLAGSPAQIEAVKKQYGIYSARVEQPGGGYSVDHSAAVLLFGRDGRFEATIDPDEGDTPALAKLRRISA